MSERHEKFVQFGVGSAGGTNIGHERFVQAGVVGGGGTNIGHERFAQYELVEAAGPSGAGGAEAIMQQVDG